MAIGAVRVKLTSAQEKLMQERIAFHCNIGDCKRTGDGVAMLDYEGVNAFRNSVLAIKTPTTAQYVSREALLRKIDEAVTRAAGRAA